MCFSCSVVTELITDCQCAEQNVVYMKHADLKELLSKHARQGAVCCYKVGGGGVV